MKLLPTLTVLAGLALAVPAVNAQTTTTPPPASTDATTQGTTAAAPKAAAAAKPVTPASAAEIDALLADKRPASALTPKELRLRIKTAHAIVVQMQALLKDARAAIKDQKGLKTQTGQ